MTLFRYTCTFIDQHIDDKFFMWNVSVSDHCCQHCDGVVYKADSVIETVLHQDKCETIETSICRMLPGFTYFSRKKPLTVFNVTKIIPLLLLNLSLITSNAATMKKVTACI